jgi:probable DNA metabolism protein
MYWACVQDFDQWRDVARLLLANDVPPEEMDWRAGRSFAPLQSPDGKTLQLSKPVRLSQKYVQLLQTLSCFRDDSRWVLMYRLAWRAQRRPRLLEDAADRDVHRALKMSSAVKRDIHKMHAFVRFREIDDGVVGKHYVAWFESDHEILRLAAPFFCKRFRNMHWLIATPDGTALWRDGKLEFVSSQDRSTILSSDAHESLWRTYYRNICNVARINPSAMTREMPQRYWRNLPEAPEIQTLLRDGRARFVQQQRDAAFELKKTEAMRRALTLPTDDATGPSACRRCEIWRHATQAVLGEGPSLAAIMLVGQQPGDEEDLHGRPFVGPAGRELDAALQRSGLDRSDLFITNAVKHFKWEPRGKRRLHRRPEVHEILACNRWLEEEIDRVKPQVIVALGSSALRAVSGNIGTIDTARNLQLRHASGSHLVATYHPAAILRAEPTMADDLRARLIIDLRKARTLVEREVQ